jgi:hypothetical protein
MTARELILDTVKYYEEDTNRRAVVKHPLMECSYKTVDNKKCAVGRWIDEEKMEERGISWNTLDRLGAVDVLNDTYILSYLLKDEVSEINVNVWKQLQKLHDSKIYWEGTLSFENRAEFVNLLLSEYDNKK